MRVTIEHEGCKATLESDDVQAADCLELCIKALIGVGFHVGSIRDATIDMATVLTEEAAQ